MNGLVFRQRDTSSKYLYCSPPILRSRNISL